MGWLTESQYDPNDEIGGWMENPPLLMAAPHRDWWFLRKYVSDEAPDYPVVLVPLGGRVGGIRARGFEVHLFGEPLTHNIQDWIDQSLTCRVAPAYAEFHVNDIVRGRF